MKKILTLAIGLITAQAASADVFVNGYFKSNGTYVMPHYRTTPNSTILDNWSYRGNINPYTGKIGKRTFKSTRSNSYSTPLVPTFRSSSFPNSWPTISPYSGSMNYGTRLGGSSTFRNSNYLGW